MGETTFMEITAQDFLKTPEERAAYLNAAIEENDPQFLVIALGEVAKAEGMSKVSRECNLSRGSLYRALGKEGNPEFKTIQLVLNSLGLKLVVKPI